MALRIDPEGVEARVVHRLVDFQGKHVLEVGCGDGRMTRCFAAEAASVTALDPDEAAVAVAEKGIPERSVVSFRVADIATIDLPLASFDIAFFSGSL